MPYRWRKVLAMTTPVVASTASPSRSGRRPSPSWRTHSPWPGPTITVVLLTSLLERTAARQFWLARLPTLAEPAILSSALAVPWGRGVGPPVTALRGHTQPSPHAVTAVRRRTLTLILNRDLITVLRPGRSTENDVATHPAPASPDRLPGPCAARTAQISAEPAQQYCTCLTASRERPVHRTAELAIPDHERRRRGKRIPLAMGTRLARIGHSRLLSELLPALRDICQRTKAPPAQARVH